MSDLRDRIAAAIQGVDDWGGVTDPAILADAVIRELGLRRENEGETDMEDTDPHPSGAHRYVTEWEPDETD